MREVLDAGRDIPLCGAAASELFGDHHPGSPTLLLQQFAQQTAGRPGVAPALDKDVEDIDVENKALPVNRAPQSVFVPGDGNHDFVEMPFVAALRRSLSNAAGKDLTELQPPLPDRLIADLDTARSQQFLNHLQAQCITEIQPDRVADDLGRIAVIRVNRVSGCGHTSAIALQSGTAKPQG